MFCFCPSVSRSTLHISYPMRIHEYTFSSMQLRTTTPDFEDDQGAGEKREDFERASPHLLPKDHVVKKRNATTNGKRTQQQISGTTAVVGGKGNGKVVIGDTRGVSTLSQTWWVWRTLSLPEEGVDEVEAEKGGRKPAAPLSKETKREKAVALEVNKQVAANLKEKGEASTAEVAICDEAKFYIMPLVREQVDKAATVGTATSVAKPKATPWSSFLNHLLSRTKSS